MSGKGCGFRGYALHQATIAADGVDVVIEDIEIRPVVAIGEPLLRDRHADTGCNSLAKRASRGLNTRNPVVLRVPGSFAVELPETANVVERNRWVTEGFIFSVDRLNSGEMERRP